MQKTQAKHVEFTQANIDRCQCLSCPVQAKSQCAMDKRAQMQGQTDMSPQDVPKVYCSQGEATCGDLDFSKNCICPTCEVWSENDLENYKYCRDGDASRIG
jgi:hypothetical protein